MRPYLMERFGFGSKSPTVLPTETESYRKFLVTDARGPVNRKRERPQVVLYVPDDTLRGNPNFGDIRENIMNAQRLSPVRFVGPKEFFDVDPESNDLSFYFTEEWSQDTLARELETTELSRNTALKYLSAILDAVADLHGEGYLHLNLKPDTIWVSGSSARVGGLAYMQRLGEVRIAPYNPRCGAPEARQTRKEDRDQLCPATDLYAVGMIAMWMFLGKNGRTRMFGTLKTDEEWQNRNCSPKPWDPLTEYVGDFPKMISDFVGRLVAKDIDKRIQTAGEALQEARRLERIFVENIDSSADTTKQGRGATTTATTTDTAGERSLSRGAWLGIGGIALATVALVMWFAFGPPDIDQELSKQLADIRRDIVALDGGSGPDEQQRGSASTLPDFASGRQALRTARTAYNVAVKAVETDRKPRTEAEPLVTRAASQATDARKAVEADIAAVKARGETTAAALRDASDLAPAGAPGFADASRRMDAGRAALQKPNYRVAAAEFDAAGEAARRIIQEQAPLRQAALAARERFTRQYDAVIPLLEPGNPVLRRLSAMAERAEKDIAGHQWAASTEGFTESGKLLVQLRRSMYGAALAELDASLAALRSRGGATGPAGQPVALALQRAGGDRASAEELAKAERFEDAMAMLDKLRPFISAATTQLDTLEREAAEARAQAERARTAANAIGGQRLAREWAEAERLSKLAQDKDRASDPAGTRHAWRLAAEAYAAVEPAMAGLAAQRIAAAEALRKEAGTAGANRMPQFADGEKALQGAAAAARSGRSDIAIDSADGALESFRAATIQLGRARAQFDTAQQTYQRQLTAARRAGAESDPAFAQAEQEAQRAVAGNAEGRIVEAAALLQESANRLGRLAAAVEQLRPAAQAELAGARTARDELLALGFAMRPEFAEAEQRYGEMGAAMQAGAFGKVAALGRQLGDTYRQIKTHLLKLSCTVPDGPQDMVRVEAKSYDIARWVAGERFQSELRPVGGPRAGAITVAAEFCVQLAPVTRAQFRAFLASLNSADASLLPDALRSLRDAPMVANQDAPIRGVPYAEAKKYVAWLAAKTGRLFALPSPEEWLAANIALQPGERSGGEAPFQATSGRDWTNRPCAIRNDGGVRIGPASSADVDAGCMFDWEERESQGLRVVLRTTPSR